jgi:hypothetical protein
MIPAGESGEARHCCGDSSGKGILLVAFILVYQNCFEQSPDTSDIFEVDKNIY